MSIQAISTRVAYGEALVALAAYAPFVVLDADLSKATQTCHFAAAYPERFYNMGIGEENLYAAAAGIASCGIPVVASTFAVFAAGRAFEPIRQTLAHTNMNVIIAATHGGVLIGQDGGTHQAIEDLSLMRSLPNMTVLIPADASATPPLLKAALNHTGPVYLRFDRFAAGAVYEKPHAFSIGGSTRLVEGNDVALLAIGSMVPIAVNAAKLLQFEGYSASVFDMYSLKPLDEATVLSAARHHRLLVTIEDHSILGGLGSAICELTAGLYPCHVLRIGIPDVFGRSGLKDELASYYGLTPEAVAQRVISQLHP